jgi:hypothetical protein
MTEVLGVLNTGGAWVMFGAAVLVFGLAPGAVLRVTVLLYPHADERRRELIAELYMVPRWERPFWVAEQFETAAFEGLSSRLEERRARKEEHRKARELHARFRELGESSGVIHLESHGQVKPSGRLVLSSGRSVTLDDLTKFQVSEDGVVFLNGDHTGVPFPFKQEDAE